MGEPLLTLSEWRRAPRPSFPSTDDMPQPAELLGFWSSDYGACDYSAGCKPPVLSIPPLPCDLNAGIERYVAKRSVTGSVETVVRAAIAAGVPPAAWGVVTFRNPLNRIGGTVLDEQAAWTLEACFVEGTLFLQTVKSPSDEKDYPGKDRFVAWGAQYECKFTGAADADANQECCALVRTQLGACTVILGAETDCYEPSAPDSAPTLLSLRELKTTSHLLPVKPLAVKRLYGSKFAAWWLQSHLAGVPTIISGRRDEKGVIRAIDTVHTADLPRLAAEKGQRWSPHDMVAFIGDVLALMCRYAEHNAGAHVRFSLQAGIIRAAVLPGGSLPARLASVLAEGGAAVEGTHHKRAAAAGGLDAGEDAPHSGPLKRRKCTAATTAEAAESDCRRGAQL